MTENPDSADDVQALLELDEDPNTELTLDEEVDLVEAEDAPPASIAYSGQDFDVAGLVRRLNTGDILIPTFGHEDPNIASAGFQRSFVWTRKQMDRFIESLLLGYPVPGIFLVRQQDRRYLVLDGQQRLRTLQAFEEGVHGGRQFSLDNVGTSLKGKTYKSLTEEQRRLLDDAFITATIVATDGTYESLESVYQVFERLNSGGTQLTPHEIRVALFAGPLIDFLEQLNNDPNWRTIYGKKSARLRDQELVLRILALYEDAAAYKRPLKGFLNGFVARHRDLANLDTDTLRGKFAEACRLIAAETGGGPLRWQGKQVNAALTESVLVGMMKRLDANTAVNEAAVAGALAAVRDDRIVGDAVSKATADEDSVRNRLERSTAAFAEV